MSTRFRTVVVLAALLLGPRAWGQTAPLHELNRVFTLTSTHLVALELDGTIAWMTPLNLPMGGGFPPAGVLVDPRGYLWFANTLTQSLYRYRTDGSFDLSIPLPTTGAISGRYMYSAIDRNGDLYITLREHIWGVGIRSKLVKVTSTPTSASVVWLIDLTPQIFLSSPPNGIAWSTQVDEDGNIWVPLTSEQYAGGRIVKLSPSGTILASIQATCGSFQLNTDRTLITDYYQGFAARVSLTIPPFSPTLPIFASAGGSTPTLAHSHPSNDWFIDNGESLIRYRTTPPPAMGFVEPIGVADPVNNLLNYNLTDPAGFVQTGPVYPGAGFDPLGRQWFIGTRRASGHLMQFFAAKMSTQAPWNVDHFTWISLPVSDSAAVPTGRMGLSLYRYCLIVDPWSDLDQDGVANRNEICSGTNPLDASSTPGSIDRNSLILGQTTNLNLSSPADSNLPYISLLSPNLPWTLLGDGRGIGPDPALDPFAAFWLSPSAGFVTGVAGILDAAGKATLGISIPNVPSLDGTQVNFSYVTLDSSWSNGVKTLFGPQALTLCAPGANCP